MSDARIDYNLRKSGVLWTVRSLPAPFDDLDPATVEFAEAVEAAQAKLGIAVDGKLGPATLAALSTPTPSTTGVVIVDSLISTALAEAEAEVREIGGANRGPRVEEFQRSVGLRPGDPWCAAFVAWCVTQSRGLATPPSWCSGSAITTWQKATRKVGPSGFCTPLFNDYRGRIGAGWVWVRAKDEAGAGEARRGNWVQGHCGIVVAVDSVGFHTVEGNTNSAGSRDGDGVYRKTHRWTDSHDLARTIGWFDSSRC
ncbi:Peptidoglycan binding-like [uncultured Caudovirales phage]|uniref:Peptidoglycan binding-like n=1 Tax=uncultured Caudovirales phage TaxID=2100421 RepID=A0A6J5MZG6_9CAUD|nr:Peptidoglycan binding-like [uncultured Caudovirales phage]